MPSYKVKVEGETFDVTIVDGPTGASVTVEGKTFLVEPQVVRPAAPTKAAGGTAMVAAGGGSGSIFAPIPGVVTAIVVNKGDRIEAGRTVLKLEAMKMQNDIQAPISGTVKDIPVSVGAEIKYGQLLLVIE